MPEPFLIRSAGPGDHLATRALIDAAFDGGSGVSRLVEDLRNDGAAEIELVAELNGALIGHILFSRLGAPFTALALAPLGVDEGHRCGGVGASLVREGLDCAAARGWHGVFVLGDAAYYSRFGFTVEAAAGFECRYAGPHFMALGLGGALPAMSGALNYSPAFERLD